MAKVVKVEMGTYYKYPWDKLLDGRVWELKKGDDFESLHALRNAAYAMGERRGLKVAVHRRGDSAFLQARPA